MSQSFKEAIKATLMITVAFLILGCAAEAVRAYAEPALTRSYAHRYSFIPGHWFGERMAKLRTYPDRSTCVVIGASNAREAFDPSILQDQDPSTRFINAATTGGNNEVLEIQARILRRQPVRPRCVIAGVTMWMMFRDGGPSLTGEEYLGLLGWPEIVELESRPLLSRAGPRIAAELVLPVRTQARQLNRIVRSTVLGLRENGGLSRSDFELYENELLPAQDYLYYGQPDVLQEDWDELVERSTPFYPPTRYGAELQTRSLRATLDLLTTLSGKTVLVLTPQTPILDPASRSGAHHVQEVLADYEGRIVTIDCSELDDFTLFHDEGHLNAAGRAILSQEVGAILHAVLNDLAQSPQPHCHIGAFSAPAAHRD